MSEIRLSFGSQYKFPLKLYEVVNDGVLLQWNSSGDGIIAEEREYEEHVMDFYPGFVQVGSFHNLKRLFRDYTFDFRFLRKRKPLGAKAEFRHQFFIRGSPALLTNVRKKKRRRFRDPLATSSPKNWQRRGTRRRSYRLAMKSFLTEASDLKECSHSDTGEADSYANGLAERSDSEISYTNSNGSTQFRRRSSVIMFDDHRHRKSILLPTHQQVPRRLRTKSIPEHKDTSFNLLQIFAKNELSESEYWDLATRNCGRKFNGKTWEEIVSFLDEIVNHELSPLHFKGFYYNLELSEL